MVSDSLLKKATTCMSNLPSRIEWESLAQKLTFPSQAFIDGEYVDAQNGATFTNYNPANGLPLGEIAACDASDVDRAVTAARRSFNAGVWAALAPTARKQVLQRFATLLMTHRAELALLETLDMGKPIHDSWHVDIPAASHCLAWFAESIDKWLGEIAPLPSHLLGTITREPLGVVAAIVPWNFPLLMAIWKIAPALATGNSVILKPSEKSPLTALRLGALAQEAGIPAGVFNVLSGLGAHAGQPLAEHPDVDGVFFTGSTATGKTIMAAAACSNLKRVGLELGGKSPHIILPDCPDLTSAARAAAGGIFYNQGEMCSAGSRLLLHRSIHDDFLTRLQQAAARYQPGHPLEPRTRLGAIVDQIQFQRVLDYIKLGQAQGATLAFGGNATCAELGGYFIEPTIFTDVNNQMTIAREEIFGPVLAVIPFDTLEEAIEIANDTDYGLAAAVWTRDLNTAHHVTRRLRAGTVWVNSYEEGGDMNLPFGGYKQSGMGRDKSWHALEKYTELKSTLFKLG